MSTLTATAPQISLSQRGQRAPEQPISRLMGFSLSNPNAISLAAGFVDNESLPVSEVAAACERLLHDEGMAPAALQYGSNVGHAKLRTAIANRYFENSPSQYAERMILTAGSNQFLQLASECLLDAGDIVLCAAPTYFVYLYVLRDLQARAYGIEADQYGMIPSELENAFEKLETRGELHRVKVLYLVPYFDNPAATTMTVERRREILNVLDRWRDRVALTTLIDNAYRDLRFEGGDIPSFTDMGADPDRTVETGTFSKNLSPGLRVGWGTPPEPLRTAMDRRKSLTDFGSPHFNQMLVANILAQGRLDQHLEVLRDTYRVKRDAMVAACDRYLSDLDGVHYQVPNGGLYVWLRLADEFDLGPSGSIWQRAMDAGVLYVPGEFFYAAEGHPCVKSTARLTFGVQSPERISEGIRIFAEVVKH